MSQSVRVIAPTLTVVNGIPTCVSTDVARHFGKQHRNVLRAIENLLLNLPQECLLNFEQASIQVAQPRGGMATYTAYRLTKDGFTLLAMGFTGKEALQFKLAYIDAFNRMEAEMLQSVTQSDEMTPIDVRALLLNGQSSPPVERPHSIDKAIDKRAWDLYELAREHLQRSVAYNAEKGYAVRALDVDAAIDAIESITLDDALAHVWVRKISCLRWEAEYYVHAGQKLMEELEALDRRRPVPGQLPTLAS
jgi:Rha family phage regulatory protein